MGTNNFVNGGATGTLVQGEPLTLGPPTLNFRFYMTRRSLSSEPRITYQGPFLPIGRPSGGPQQYQQTLLWNVLATTKSRGGIIGEAYSPAAQFEEGVTDPYQSFGHIFATEPLGNQTTFGTITCVIGSRGPTAGDTQLIAHAWVLGADGTTNKGTLGTGFGTDFNPWNAVAGFRPITINMASVAIADGDRVVVEIGAKFVGFIGPAVDEGVTGILGTTLTVDGAGLPDGVAGGTNGLTACGHITFSNGLTVRPTVWSGVNDTCGGATELGSTLPIQFGPLDTTDSPGVDPGSQGGDPNIRNQAWFKFTSPITGKIIVSALDSNYRVYIRGYTTCGGGFPNIGLSNHRPMFVGQSQSAGNFDAVAGTTYYLAFSSDASAPGSSTSGGTALQSGGQLRFSIFARLAPETDDLYLAGKHIFVYRKIGGSWQPINYNNGLTYGFIPTGMTFDYSRSGVPSLNAGEATDVDLLVSSLFFFNLLEAFNAITLNESQFEYNFQCMGFGNVGPGADMPSDARGGNVKVIP